jgi:hypothetical protein
MSKEVAKQEQGEHYKGVIEGVQKLFDDKRKSKQEQGGPVAWMREDATLRFAEGKVFAVGQPFYTTPLKAKSAVPEGWKLVPIEPTGVMKDCGATALPLGAGTWNSADAYRAMLKAAPQWSDK